MCCSSCAVHTFLKIIFKVKYINHETQLLEMRCIAFGIDGINVFNVTRQKLERINVQYHFGGFYNQFASCGNP